MSKCFNPGHHSEKVLHLYRAILRECSYLPDSVARRETTRQVRFRFRRSHEKHNGLVHDAVDHHDGNTRRLAAQKLQLKIGQARKAWRTLHHANHGGILSMNKVLLSAYGRTGRRRWELLMPLLQADSSGTKTTVPNEAAKWDISTVDIPNILQQPRVVSGDLIQYPISDRYGCLKGLVASQVNILRQISIKNRALKSAVYKMPATNTWGRPMPRKRVKNMTKRFYNNLLGQILPPLPHDEWQRLHDIVTRVRPCDTVPPRRKVVSYQLPEHLESKDLDVLVNMMTYPSAYGQEPSNVPLSQHRAHFDTSKSWLGQQHLREQALDQILDQEILLERRFTGKRNFGDDFHTLNQRFMRRRLQHVFMHCPKVSKTQDGSWRIDWGVSSKAEGRKEPGDLACLLAMAQLPERSRTARSGKSRRLSLQ